MPVHAKNSSRREQAAKAASKGPSKAVAQMSSAMTEEEKLAAVFQAQTENWTNAQDELPQYVFSAGPKFHVTSNHSRRHLPAFKPGAKKPVNVPDHEPPKGYVCYRCGESGHWIQLCPTNDNPEYDNRPRVKRTTGIPRSFLKTVDKATALGQMNEGDESKPSGIMVNAEGEYVIAEPDKASWEQFQAKAKSNATAQKLASQGDKEVQERGLECSIDQRMFIDPMKTPCCQKTYCNDCITNALIESDFVCPACKTEGVLIDDLKPDDEAAKKIKEFLAEQDNKKKSGSASPAPNSPPAAGSASTTTTATATGSEKTAAQQTSKQLPEKIKEKTVSKSPNLPAANAAPTATSTNVTASSTKSPVPKSTSPAQSAQGTTPVPGDQDKNSAVKKRPAEDMENPKVPKAPKAMQQAQDVQQQAMLQQMMNSMPNMANMPNMGGMMPGVMGFPGMPMMNSFGGMGMPNMNMGMMNPMMPMMGGGMPGFPNMNMNGMNGMGGMNNMNGMNGMGGMNGNFGNMNSGWQGDMNGNGLNNGGNMNGMGGGGPSNQFQQPPPHKNFSHQAAPDEDAYFRKPVNPHRHQNKQRRARPSDYREL